MVELRTETDKLIQALREGESFCLTYRGKRLARVIPETPADRPGEDDPLYRFHQGATGAEPLTDREMDAAIYELR